MTEKIGCLIIDVAGFELSPDESELLAHPLVGGVILFSRNYSSLTQLKKLCQDIRATRSHSLLIMVDQEGGRVQRFKQDFTCLPSMGTLGKIYDSDSKLGRSTAYDCGFLMAAELLATDIDMGLSPVLDLNKGISTVIGDRAFHHDPQVASLLAKDFMQGMQAAGMAATGKHFPGHGSVRADSHIAVPVDERSWDEIKQSDLIPFVELIHARIAALMAAHIIFPQIDTAPVSFSRSFLQDILRKELKFTGTVLSDDLNMKGADISDNYADRVQAAFLAGCDFTLLCNNHQAVIQVLDTLSYQSYLLNETKWKPLQAKFAHREAIHLQEKQRFLLESIQKYSEK